MLMQVSGKMSVEGTLKREVDQLVGGASTASQWSLGCLPSLLDYWKIR